MTLLTGIITHLRAHAVERQLRYLRALAPASRFVICYGGPKSDFEQLKTDSVFVDDPAMRGPLEDQSYTAALCALYDGYVRDDPTVELVYLIEYDQLILRGDFERSLLDMSERTGAGLIGKSAAGRNDTNWTHYLRFRGDPRFDAFVAGISCRDDPGLRWGCLGTGMLLRRAALAALCSLADAPPAYLELSIPTVVYHLGFELADFDALGDLYRAVRWRPEFTVGDAVGEWRAGRTFIHPFKQFDAFVAATDPSTLGD